MKTEQKEHAVEQLLSSMQEGDWDGVAEHYHDDVVVEWPQTRERMTGKETCLEVYRNYPGGLPQVTPQRTWGEGDLVVSEGEARYPDGSAWKVVELFEFRDDKIAKETAYFAQQSDPPEWRKELIERA